MNEIYKYFIFVTTVIVLILVGPRISIADSVAPSITSPSASETSNYIFVNGGTTIYYGNNMASTQYFDVSGSASDETGLAKAEFSDVFFISPGVDYLLGYSDNWQGTYGVTSSDTFSGYITVTVYDTSENKDTFDFTVIRDNTNPTNPNAYSSFHNDGKIDIIWSGASDDESGVYGYSVVWDKSPTTIPDSSVDILDTQMKSPSLGDDDWYFHVKTVDNVNNWTGDAYHAGPFNAVPIPGAVWLLGSGLISIVGIRKKLGAYPGETK